MPPKCSNSASRAVKDGGQSLWHRLQRSWPLVRVGKSTFPKWFVSKEVALYPCSTRDDFGIQVTVDKIKQGTFDTRPATLLIFSALFGDLPSLKEVCFEIRCLLKNEHSNPPSVLYAGAFGPSFVTEWRVTDNSNSDSHPLPATITARPFQRGVLVVARSGRPGHGGIPRLLRFGVVVVHSGEADLMVFPSTSGAKRATTFRRTRITPTPLDLAREAGPFLITCAKQGDAACHPSCDDLGPEHMTPAVWKQHLAQGYTKDYHGESPLTSWVDYIHV